jgi:hypothetical protein
VGQQCFASLPLNLGVRFHTLNQEIALATRKPRIQKQESELSKTVAIEAAIPIRSKALVFVSHDSRDADIAEAFANLLSDVSAGTLKSFRSSDKKGNTGIEFGAEWYTSIMSQLGDATDVVALLTARSIDRPWILYEAGVARGKLDTTVLGLALGVPLDKISTGPFGQFQNCGDDEDSLTKLVMQLLQRNPDAAPREEAVRMQVRLFIESLAKILASKPKKGNTESASDDQNVAKLFEEVKAMVRELPQKVDAQVRVVSRRSNSKSLRRFGPKIFEELIYRSTKGEGIESKGTALLIILSFIKDDLPWLYELGMQIYRAMAAGDKDSVIVSHKQIHSTMEFMVRSPLGHDLYRDDEESFMTIRVIPELIDRVVFEYLESTPTRRRLSKPTSAIKGTET